MFRVRKNQVRHPNFSGDRCPPPSCRSGRLLMLPPPTALRSNPGRFTKKRRILSHRSPDLTNEATKVVIVTNNPVLVLWGWGHGRNAASKFG